MSTRHLRLKIGRYTLASVATTALSQAILVALALAWPHLDSVVAVVITTVLATGPAFVLQRRWVWRQSGPSHVRREVIPFFALAVLGLVIATLSVALASHLAAGLTTHHLLHAAVIDGAYLGSYAVTWVLRFVVLEAIVFHHRAR